MGANEVVVMRATNIQPVAMTNHGTTTKIPEIDYRPASFTSLNPPGGNQPDESVSPPPTSNILIARLEAKADLTQAEAMPRGPERKQAVYDALLATAKESQKSALEALSGLQKSGDVSSVTQLFLPNAILIKTKTGRHQAVAEALRGVANISKVSENRMWSEQPETGASPHTNDAPQDGQSSTDKLEWGVARIGAPAAWSQGIDGTGVTIGVVDTGLDVEHPAIRSHFRGTNTDGTITYDYNWFDPFQHTPQAFDDGDHGTHVAGTSAGGTDGRMIGVAPGAKLIAAKAINKSGYNTTAATLEALQFMLAPTKTDGTAPDPRRGADVVNNSWGNQDKADDTFIESLNGLKAAGIEVVSAAGNDGPREGTVSPPGSYPGFLSVAATTSSDSVASFSSRGPSRFASPDEMTPNVSAPGAGIVSSVPGGRFQSMSGTSMAAPHVAGAVALMLNAAPQATHEQIVGALTSTAKDIDRAGPDNASGFGLIDVVAAINALQASPKNSAPRPVAA